MGAGTGRPGDGRLVTLLVISPDYASHLYPLATLATAWREAGERVVVATGPATHDLVEGFGYVRTDLRLGRGSNPGVIRPEDQPRGEDDALRGFFDATRRGPVPTLVFQARARRTDLLWDPVGTGRQVQRLVDRVQPDHVIVDHLAFSARIALMADGIRHADVVLGHPTALPVGDEVYGCPPAFPRAVRPEPEDLADLRRLCEDVRDDFTEQWNAALAVLAPNATPSEDAFAETGDVLLLNYPAELHPPTRTAALADHAFLGSAVRAEPRDDEVASWLEGSDLPVVYVSLGSFLSVRSDVLARVAEALRRLDVRVALASGATTRDELGPVPDSWLVRPVLPQVTVLGRAALAVSHGGNNSVTEALTAGVPLLLLPLSTDQFAGAAALEDAGLGQAVHPNTASPQQIRDAASRLLGLPPGPRAVMDRLCASLVDDPGARRAWVALRGL